LEKSTKRKEDGVGGMKKRRGREKKVGDGIFFGVGNWRTVQY
jgi:hypothetical protein